MGDVADQILFALSREDLLVAGLAAGAAVVLVGALLRRGFRADWAS